MPSAYPLTKLCITHTLTCMTYTVNALGIRKAFGAKTVLDGVDLTVPAGQIFALLGPNGAGKTTLIRILATLLRPDAGTATVAGHDLLADPVGVRRAISLTGQYAAVDDMLTGEENLRMMGRLARLSRAGARQRATELIQRFDLTGAARRRVGTYSGGMRRRFDIAASLVGRPSVIFLDEPSTGLDPQSRLTMWQVVEGLAAGGVTVFLTTQYLEEAERLAETIAALDGGRIIAQGTAAELKQRVAAQRLDLTGASEAAYADLTRHFGDRAIHRDHASLTLGVPIHGSAAEGSAAEIRALLDTADPGRTLVASFAVQTASLDDVFLILTHNDTVKETAHV